MKDLVSWAGIFFVSLTVPTSMQQPRDADSCRFTISASEAKPTITGPEEVTALVHVVEQPDSPVEIVAADFKDSFVAVANERFTEQLRCTLKIHNRSDRWIRRVNIMVYVASASLEGAGSGLGLEGPGPSPKPRTRSRDRDSALRRQWQRERRWKSCPYCRVCRAS